MKVLFLAGAALLFAATVSDPAIAAQHAAPQPPCTANESVPEDPALRDGAVALGNPASGSVAASACLVIGNTAQQQMPYGAYLNYNFALLTPNSQLLDVNGTVANTGTFGAGTANPFTMPLSLVFPLPPGATIGKPPLVGQVAISPCDDQACDMPDLDAGYYVTTVLAGNRPGSAPYPRQSANLPRGCLDPIAREHDPELRQVTAAGQNGNYSVYACLVSSRFADFQMASFQVERLRGARGDMIDVQDGNTRLHIRPLVNSPAGGPRVLTLFGVEIPAKHGSATLVDRAHITFSFLGCADKAEQNCVFGTESRHYPVRFYPR